MNSLTGVMAQVAEAEHALDEMIDILREELFVSKESMVVTILATLAAFDEPSRVNTLAAIALTRLAMQEPTT